MISRVLLYAGLLIGALSGMSVSHANNLLGGVDLSGAEFGTALPGTLGTDYMWPNTQEIDYFASRGMNIVRVSFHVNADLRDGGKSGADVAGESLRSLVRSIHASALPRSRNFA